MIAAVREIIAGRRLGAEDDLRFLLDAPLDELCRGADAIREALVGKRIDTCAILAARSGICSEDCAFCAQSSRFATGCDTHKMVGVDAALAAARESDRAGVGRFALVTSGRALSGDEFEAALMAYRRMRDELGIGLCASMGLLGADQLQRLKDAGVKRYHCNIETSRRFFARMCTTHSYDDKIATIRAAQGVGLDVCSGGIIGMGESWEDRIDMALALAKLGIRSIPVNVLVAIEGTPLAGQPPLVEDEIMRAIAIFRYLNPEADIRLAGGRILMCNAGERAFSCGASATITGDMLTTAGYTIASDKALFRRLGRL